jgi:ABC-type amino acid transport substrate-binding protein
MRSRGILVVIVVAFEVSLVGPAGSQEFRPTLQKIKETGSIDLGYRETSPPLSFRDKDGKPTGYAVDLCQQVAVAIKGSSKLAELTLNWVPVRRLIA